MTDRPNPLRDHLAGQLGAAGLTDEDRRLALHLITFVDRTGYVGRRDEQDAFRTVSLLEIGDTFEPPAATDEVERVLHAVQRLDPAGVAARDLRECLLLQVRPDTPHRDLVREIVVDHLDDAAHDRQGAIRTRTGAEAQTISEALDVLRGFDPKPGLRLCGR